MKKLRRALFISVAIFLLAAGPAFSQMPNFDLSDLDDAINSFSGAMAQSLPFNATMGLNWSDAYIGQLLSIPPHFGVGISMGATFMNIGVINDMLSMFEFDIPLDIPIGFPLPGYTVEGRVGGIILPFDVGIKFGAISPDTIPLLDSMGIGLNYLLFGMDVRYSVLPSFLPVKLSVGLGFNYLSGGISANLGGGQSFSFDDPVNSSAHTIAISDPSLELFWETTVFELKAQASMSLFIITPYAGFGLSYSMSNAGYRLNSQVTIDGDPVNESFAALLSEFFGINNLTDQGFESRVNADGAINFRFFGGFSVNMFVLKLDMTLMYNFTDSSLGGTLGLRLQL